MTWGLLPHLKHHMFLGILTLAAMLAAGVAAVAGFGIGSILTPLAATQLGMKTAVVAISVPHFIATLLRFWRLRSHIDRRVLFDFGVVNAAGALAGALLHSMANNPALTWLLATLLIFAGVLGLFGYSDRLRFGPKAAWAAGALSGAFGGLVGNQGGIRSAAMLGLGVSKEAFVATATAIALLVDLVRMPVYFAYAGTTILNVRVVILLCGIGVIMGTLVGERILRRIPPSIFRRVVAGILFAAGLGLWFMPGK